MSRPCDFYLYSLTCRVLPRLQVSPDYKPSLLHYPPYSKQQIMDILTARLQGGAKDGTGAPVITTRAIAFLAGKIASLSGDLRKALDVCRRALELSETIARKQSLLKRGLASPGKSPRKGYLQPRAAAQAGQVDVAQIMKVINQVYGSQLAVSLGTKGDGLPLKQKILMASLLLMVKRGRSKEVTLGKLSETYARILRRRQMEAEQESACVGKTEDCIQSVSSLSACRDDTDAGVQRDGHIHLQGSPQTGKDHPQDGRGGGLRGSWRQSTAGGDIGGRFLHRQIILKFSDNITIVTVVNFCRL